MAESVVEVSDQILGKVKLPYEYEPHFADPCVTTVKAHDGHDYVVVMSGNTVGGVAIVHAAGCRACADKTTANA